MATIAMREVREGEVPEGRRHRSPGGRRAARLQRQRARRLRLRAVRQRARQGMDAAYMTKKVRVRCGRCRTVNVAVTDESVDPRRSRR